MYTEPVVATPTGVAMGAAGSRARVVIVVIALVLGTIGSAGLGLWHPAPDTADDLWSYGLVAGIRDLWWAWHVFGGLATAIVAVALGVAVCLLAPVRGSVWANLGAVLTALGGLCFFGGVAGEGILGAYVTDPDALPVEAGTAFWTHFSDNFAPIGAILIPGFLLLTIGPLLLAVALWRAKSVPRWLPIAMALSNVATFFIPFGVLADVLNVIFFGAVVATAWYLWRTTTPQRGAST